MKQDLKGHTTVTVQLRMLVLAAVAVVLLDILVFWRVEEAHNRAQQACVDTFMDTTGMQLASCLINAHR